MGAWLGVEKSAPFSQSAIKHYGQEERSPALSFSAGLYLRTIDPHPTQDCCLVLQQALNLVSQIRLLGALAPNTPFHAALLSIKKRGVMNERTSTKVAGEFRTLIECKDTHPARKEPE